MMEIEIEPENEKEALKKLLSMVRKSMGGGEEGLDGLSDMLKGIEGDQASFGGDEENENVELAADLGEDGAEPMVEEGLEESGDSAMDPGKPDLKQEMRDFFAGKKAKPVTPKKGFRVGMTSIQAGPAMAKKMGKKSKII